MKTLYDDAYTKRDNHIMCSSDVDEYIHKFIHVQADKEAILKFVKIMKSSRVRTKNNMNLPM